MIELMVVSSLIVVFASLALVQYRYSVIRAREAVLREDLFRLRDAIDQYHADKNRYPQRLEDLVTDGYLRQIPVDPMTDSPATWQAVPAEPRPGEEFEPGIYDVKSGSEAVAMDGTRYADW
jgi:general secretion pathway protein G